MSQRRKSIRKSKKSQIASRKSRTSLRQKLITAGVVVLALLFALSMFFSTPKASNTAMPSSRSKSAEPQFIKEGSLQFLKNGNIIKAIEIEVADTPKETQQGLMYRQKMGEDKGMLFIFPDMQPRGFWMKNTLISLDIIYVDAEKRIVSIQKNTTPLSEQSLPSDGKAQYVVEVNAGFVDNYGLEAGDEVDFQMD